MDHPACQPASLPPSPSRAPPPPTPTRAFIRVCNGTQRHRALREPCSVGVSECRAVSGQCRGSVRAVSGQCRLTLVSECRAVSEQCQSSVGQVVYSLSIQPAALQTLWGALEAPVSRIGESGTTGPLRPAHPAPHTLTGARKEVLESRSVMTAPYLVTGPGSRHGLGAQPGIRSLADPCNGFQPG